MVLFVNGLPLVVVELKSPSREETDASAAYRQLRNYMHEIPSLFIYNQVCVMSDLAIHLQGGHHHLRRGSLHGVEDQGRQLRKHPARPV